MLGAAAVLSHSFGVHYATGSWPSSLYDVTKLNLCMSTPPNIQQETTAQDLRQKNLAWRAKTILKLLVKRLLHGEKHSPSNVGVSENKGYLILGVLIIRILLLRVLYYGALFSESRNMRRTHGQEHKMTEGTARG